MQAIILAGGFGTRLKTIINDLPKPMAPVLDKPFLEYLILMLKNKGIIRFVFCLHYLPHKIEDYFGDGKKFGVEIKYSYEDTPLFSAGALKKAEDLLDEDFIVVNGDNYCNFDYNELFQYHKQNNALITIAVQNISSFTKGVVHTLLLEKGMVKDYYGRNENDLANAAVEGIFVVKKEILGCIQNNMPISLEHDLIPKYTKLGKVFGLINNSYFIDIGTPEMYNKFIQDVKNKIV